MITDSPKGRSIIDGNVYFGNGDERDVCVNQRACRIFREGNCRISFCNNEDKEVCDSSKEWGRRTKAIISYCEPDDGGGYESPAEPKPWTEVAIRANTDWKAAMKAAAGESAGVTEEVMTLEENEAEVKQIEEEQKAKHALHARVSQYAGLYPNETNTPTGRRQLRNHKPPKECRETWSSD